MKKIVFVLLTVLVASCKSPEAVDPTLNDTIITDSIPVPFDTIMYPFDSSVEIIDTPKK
jgi:hypothetical protein